AMACCLALDPGRSADRQGSIRECAKVEAKNTPTHLEGWAEHEIRARIEWKGQQEPQASSNSTPLRSLQRVLSQGLQDRRRSSTRVQEPSLTRVSKSILRG